MEAVSLLAGLFLHFSSLALIFPCRLPWSPHPSLRMLPLPPPPICQPSQERGPQASKVIELLGGRQARVFCVSASGFLPLERGWRRGATGGDCGPWVSQTALLSPVWATDECCH